MQSQDPSKRIPKSLGTDTQLLGKYSLTDLAMGLFPSVVVVLLVQLVLPPSLSVAGYPLQSLTLPLAVVTTAIGAVVVYVTPWYTTTFEWVGSMIGFHRRPRNLEHEAAREFTRVERIYPETDAIERTDDAMVGVVEVTPPTMALATDEEWSTKADSFEDFLNTVVEFPIQIFSTTRAFPVDEYLAHYESRLEDPDVETNPRLRALVEEYVRWYRRDLEDRRMTIREHYVVVPVTPRDVRFEHESLAEKLATLPLVGIVLEAVFAPPVTEERAALLEALDERLDQITGGVREIEGCNAHRVSSTEAAELIGDFWAGTPREYGELTESLRTRPLVGGIE